MARQAAMHGREYLRDFYASRTPAEKKKINAIKDELEKLME